MPWTKVAMRLPRRARAAWRYGTIASDEPPRLPHFAPLGRAAAPADTAARGAACAAHARAADRLLRPALAGATGGRLGSRANARRRGSEPERAPAPGGQSARAHSICAPGARAGRL